MNQVLRLLRAEPSARRFFAALAQSSLGTGAAYVALLLLAYDRLASPFAVALVLLADFLPAMFLGPILGAAADRWSRRGCAVIADVLRAVAFIALGVVGSFEATVAFALLAGVGTALFKPAVLAGLPSLVSREQRASATSLYSAVVTAGDTVGPAIAAGAMLVITPATLLIANGATFAVSAVVIAGLPLDRAERASDPERRSLLAEAREGLRATTRMIGIRTVITVSAAAMFFGGMFNVAEVSFAKKDLGTTASGFSAMVAVFGLGFILGSLRGASGGTAHVLKRGYLAGLFVMAAGGVCVGLAPGLAVALPALTVAGFGNGLLLVHERHLLQTEVDKDLQGRVFAITETFVSWGFALAFLCGGAVTATAGARPVVLATGLGNAALAVLATLGLRHYWRRSPTRAEVVPASTPGVTPPTSGVTP
jgi:MFS family permease